MEKKYDYSYQSDYVRTHYSTLTVRMQKEMQHAFAEKCKQLNVSQAEVIKSAIKKFLEE